MIKIGTSAKAEDQHLILLKLQIFDNWKVFGNDCSWKRHKFLISVLKKIGFGQNFIWWIEIILKNHESCAISGGVTTKYFKLNRGVRQRDRVSAFLLILVLEILVPFIKENSHINWLNIFDHN